MHITTKAQLVKTLVSLGYSIDERMSFNYVNRNNGQSYKARACCIVEADTGISFAHHSKARRDANFDNLQKLRPASFLIRGRIYEV